MAPKRSRPKRRRPAANNAGEQAEGLNVGGSRRFQTLCQLLLRGWQLFWGCFIVALAAFALREVYKDVHEAWCKVAIVCVLMGLLVLTRLPSAPPMPTASSSAPTAALFMDTDFPSSSAPAFASKVPLMMIRDDAATLGKDAAELAEKILAVLNKATDDARGVIADAKHKLTARDFADSTVWEQVQIMKEVLLNLVAAWDLQNRGTDDLQSSFSELLRGVREMEMEIARLQGYADRLEQDVAFHQGRESRREARVKVAEDNAGIVTAYMEGWKGHIMLGECGYAWARLLQNYMFQEDNRSLNWMPMLVSEIIRKAADNAVHWERCCQVLDYAEQHFNLTEHDLKRVDGILREDRREPAHGKTSDKLAIEAKHLLQYASVAYAGAPDVRWQVEQIIHLLKRFSPQGKPLDAKHTVFKHFIQQG